MDDRKRKVADTEQEDSAKEARAGASLSPGLSQESAAPPLVDLMKSLGTDGRFVEAPGSVRLPQSPLSPTSDSFEESTAPPSEDMFAMNTLGTDGRSVVAPSSLRFIQSLPSPSHEAAPSCSLPCETPATYPSLSRFVTHFHSDGELIVALSTEWFARGRRCHRRIRITSAHGHGRTVEARVVDECNSRRGCRHNIVDSSPAVWRALGLDTDVGEVPVTWSDA